MSPERDVEPMLRQVATEARTRGAAGHQEALAPLAGHLIEMVRGGEALCMDRSADVAHLLYRWQLAVREDERSSK